MSNLSIAQPEKFSPSCAQVFSPGYNREWISPATKLLSSNIYLELTLHQALDFTNTIKPSEQPCASATLIIPHFTGEETEA